MKKLLYLNLIFLIILLSSCFDYKELKNVSFCFGMSIDYNTTGEEKYVMNIETEVIENHVSETNFEVTIHETKGNNFTEAYANLSSTTSGLIDFSHCQLIIISQYINILDLKSLINSLFNNTMIPNSIAVLVSKAPTASEVLETESITNASLSFEIIYALKENTNYYNGTFKKTITQLYNDLNSHFGNFLLPTVLVSDIKDKKFSTVSGAFIYNNFTMKKFLDNNELRDTLLIEKKLNTVLYNLVINQETIGICIDSFKRKVTVNESNTINFHFEFTLPVSITNPKSDKNEIKLLFKEQLEKELVEYFNSNKNNDIDIYNLTNYLYKHKYSLYKKNINKLDIQNFNFTVNINVNIKEKGIVR